MNASLLHSVFVFSAVCEGVVSAQQRHRRVPGRGLRLHEREQGHRWRLRTGVCNSGKGENTQASGRQQIIASRQGDILTPATCPRYPNLCALFSGFGERLESIIRGGAKLDNLQALSGEVELLFWVIGPTHAEDVAPIVLDKVVVPKRS